MNQQQTQPLSVEKVKETINKLETSISNAEKAKLQAETKRDSLRTQYEQLNNEIRALDVDPATAKEHVVELGKEILETIESLKELIPQGF